MRALKDLFMFEIIFNDSDVINFEQQSILFLKSLDVKHSSRYTYQRQLKEFLHWYKKHSKAIITREHILDYKDYLKQDKQLSALTIAGYLTAVRKFFEWLEIEKVYPNYAKGIKNPKRKRGFKKDALTAVQVKKIFRSIPLKNLIGKRDFAILNLMIRTGLRTIEVIRANQEDITHQAGNSLLWVHGKGRDSKDEVVVLTQKTLTPIRDYIKARGRVRDEDPLFCSHSSKNVGKRLTTRSISRIVKERLRKAGIDDARITAHSLRHTAITLSLLAGATPQEARAMARHADINTTMIYAHNINRIEQAPERKIDTILD
jgi:integrase/recombinase XerD